MTTSLQMDVGNTYAKWRVQRAGEIIARGGYAHGDNAGREAMLRSVAGVDHIWLASVAGAELEHELAGLLRQRWRVEPWFARTPAVFAGLTNSYAEPERMGVDRWLAMLGARARCAGRICVVDAGSALTIDLVAADGRHEGGYIIPGPALMERALLLDTDRVRFDDDVAYALPPGKSTAAAVRHGIALAQVGAVTVALRQAGNPAPRLFFCGGAGKTLMALLGQDADHAPDLVFEGLELMAASVAATSGKL